MTPDRFFLLYALDPVDAWRADLMVWGDQYREGVQWLREQSKVVRLTEEREPAFKQALAVEDASRETLLERLGQSYPGVRILELVENAEANT